MDLSKRVFSFRCLQPSPPLGPGRRQATTVVVYLCPDTLMTRALPLDLFWSFIGLIWVTHILVLLRRLIRAKSVMEVAPAKNFPSLYFSWLSQRKHFMISVAY